MSAGIFIVSDKGYLLPTKCLIHSLNKHNDLSRVPINIITEDPDLANDPYLKVKAEKFIPTSEDNFKTASRQNLRLVKAYYKLESFRDYGYDCNVVIDADMLCIRSIEEVFDPDSFAGDFLAAPDWVRDDMPINSGFFVVKKSIQSELVKNNIISHISPHDPHGDQNAINKWIRSGQVKISHLPICYNAQIKRIGNNDCGEDTKMIHWSGPNKPWNKRTPQAGKWEETLKELTESISKEV